MGGCVRKYILNEKIDDIDIATTLTPNEIMERFENTDVKVKKTGIEHGTLTLVLKNQHFEITTLRKDTSTDGRHATVSFTDNWDEDSNSLFRCSRISVQRRAENMEIEKKRSDGSCVC